MQFLFDNARRVTIKLGTGILTSGKNRIDLDRVRDIAGQVAALREKGLEVVIVSSGAVGLGMGQLGLKKRPADLPELQACAAVGQTILINTWQASFDTHGHKVAQILLTHDDVSGRRRHVAIKDTLEKLLAMGVIPIVNENDTVNAEEIRFGDNDILSALVAILTKSDMLLILSTIPGLLDRKGSGDLVTLVEKITPDIERMAEDTKSTTSVGGMRTKIEAAKQATNSGCGVFIGSGLEPNLLTQLFDGQASGTFFMPANIAMHSKKRWIAFFERPQGTVQVDSGARDALREKGSSLLASGVTKHEGRFKIGEIINIAGSDGSVFARGISQFDSEEMDRIAGQSTEEIRRIFPGRKRFEVIHRDSLALLG